MPCVQLPEVVPLRAAARAEKAVKVFPRPVKGALRPVVRGQTVRYNLKKRFGRGFTFEELKVGLCFHMHEFIFGLGEAR